MSRLGDLQANSLDGSKEAERLGEWQANSLDGSKQAYGASTKAEAEALGKKSYQWAAIPFQVITVERSRSVIDLTCQ